MSAQNNVESFDGLLDFSHYQDAFQSSPSLSPASPTKSQIAQQPLDAMTTPTMPSTTSPHATLSGPSHRYELYRQQTGFVPGALSNTMALNTGLDGFDMAGGMGYVSPQDFFDFAAASGELDMDFAGNDFVFDTVNPAATIQQQASPSVASSTALASPAITVSTTSSIGRMYPGAHSQAALAKAQAQKQQQLTIQHQQQRQLAAKPQPKLPPVDPMVDHKISQILQSMRTKCAADDAVGHGAVVSQSRMRKDEDEMDEDERLLASEEGKKLSSKERRQLRNKVSARAFRSRRKEYISQLESEITAKNAHNNELRSQNRALLEENKRLGDLTRMLLSSSSFSSFLDQMTNDAITQGSAANSVKPEERQEQGQIPKDANPYAAQPGSINIMAGTEHRNNVDFSVDPANFGSFQQPQVFTVLETPETLIDTSIFSGKTSAFVDDMLSPSDKVDMPLIERPEVGDVEQAFSPADAEFASEFESDPSFALYHVTPTTLAAGVVPDFARIDLFAGINTEKLHPRFHLVDTIEQEAASTTAFERIRRISASLDSLTRRVGRSEA